MTRKHFIAIACNIRNMKVDAETRRIIAESFADLCQNWNFRFNREAFLKACGI